MTREEAKRIVLELIHRREAGEHGWVVEEHIAGVRHSAMAFASRCSAFYYAKSLAHLHRSVVTVLSGVQLWNSCGVRVL